MFQTTNHMNYDHHPAPRYWAGQLQANHQPPEVDNAQLASSKFWASSGPSPRL